MDKLLALIVFVVVAVAISAGLAWLLAGLWGIVAHEYGFKELSFMAAWAIIGILAVIRATL